MRIEEDTSSYIFYFKDTKIYSKNIIEMNLFYIFISIDSIKHFLERKKPLKPLVKLENDEESEVSLHTQKLVPKYIS